jgi:hypothetical protein
MAFLSLDPVVDYSKLASVEPDLKLIIRFSSPTVFHVDLLLSLPSAASKLRSVVAVVEYWMRFSEFDARWYWLQEPVLSKHSLVISTRPLPVPAVGLLFVMTVRSSSLLSTLLLFCASLKSSESSLRTSDTLSTSYVEEASSQLEKLSTASFCPKTRFDDSPNLFTLSHHTPTQDGSP